MKTLKNLLCMMALVLFGSIFTFVPVKAEGNSDTIITVPITVQEEYSMANDFFQILNQNRKAAGLSEYKLDAGLTEMAMTRAAQMCIYFSHASMVSEPYEHDALGDLQQGSPIQDSIGVTEDIAEGTADAKSTYNVWYNSMTHKPALVSTLYQYCGIGVVTYHNNIKWCLIVSKDPCGKEINSVSGSKTVTRNINAKAKFFAQNIYRTIVANANSSKCGEDGYVNEMFVFADISGKSSGYYVTQSDVFTFKSNNPELFEVDSLGRIKPLKTGTGSVTVYYKGLELCTTTVRTTEKRKTETETPAVTPSQSESTKQTEPVAPPETKPSTDVPKETNPPKQTEAPKQTDSPKQTTAPKQSETQKQSEVTAPKQTETVQSNTNGLIVKVKNVVYNKKAQKPAVSVYVGKQKLAKKYYSVGYKNNKNVGYGSVIVRGKGKYAKYSGTGTFKISLKNVSLSSVKAGKKKLTATWKKTDGNQGYQLQYSTSKNFSTAKILNLSAGKKSVTVKNLESKKYYIRIRSYKKVKGEIWYSKWSKAKGITVE